MFVLAIRIISFLTITLGAGAFTQAADEPIDFSSFEALEPFRMLMVSREKNLVHFQVCSDLSECWSLMSVRPNEWYHLVTSVQSQIKGKDTRPDFFERFVKVFLPGAATTYAVYKASEKMGFHYQSRLTRRSALVSACAFLVGTLPGTLLLSKSEELQLELFDRIAHDVKFMDVGETRTYDWVQNPKLWYWIGDHYHKQNF